MARPNIRQLTTGSLRIATALMGDAKYRKFAQAVDKTLQSFDQVNEWADFITFLAKLLKAS